MRARIGRLLRRPRPIPEAARLGMDPGEPFDARPAPARAGFVVAPPDFVIAGAPDAGGPRLAALLGLHPGIHEVHAELRAWERHFETWPSDADLEHYRSHFARPPGMLSGELATTTMSMFWAPAMLAAAAPDTRIVVILRDPVDRYLAGRGRLERYRAQGPGWHYGPRSFTQWAMERAFQQGEYAWHIQWLQDTFPPDRILVLQYEGLQRDVPGTLSRVQQFLGLAQVAPSERQIRATEGLAADDAPPALEPQRVAALVELYRSEATRLRVLVPDLDQSLWPHYRDPVATQR